MKSSGERPLDVSGWESFASYASACKIPLYPPLKKGETSYPQFFTPHGPVELPLFEKEGLGEICVGRRVRGHDNIHLPSPHSFPVGDCVAIRKSHECHSEPQAKNLTIAHPYKCEILRLPPQDDIATRSLEGEEVNLCALPASAEETRHSCRTQRNLLSRVSRELCVFMVLGLLLLAGCKQKMADQPRYEPLARSTFFDDGRAARPLVEGTVARGQLRGDEHLYVGKEGGKPVDRFPSPVTLAVLTRGQQRFNIFCSPCHDRVGTGQGMIVRRGYRAPPSFHIDRLRQAPAGYFFDVMTNGFGVMPDYAQQVQPEDRWAIVAYIRALQLSQHATLADVPEDQRHQLGIKP